MSPLAPLRGVRVSATPEGDGWGTSVRTGRYGHFRLDLAPGRYVVRFQHLEFATNPRPRHVELHRHGFLRLDAQYSPRCR
jgi:hypothetical protein